MTWIDGCVSAPTGDIPRVTTRLRPEDHWGTFKARWGVGRMDYRVPPGLYAVGTPDADSPVLVSANYKMSFDRLRSVLTGRSAWLLVLDTDGINVWCAAGKGTFGTEEIVRCIESTRLPQVVSHRALVVPQLGAPGVSAPEVRKRSGFRVVFGPVDCEHLPAFLDRRLKATPQMRQVRFGLRERAVLIPMELSLGIGYGLFVAAAFLVLGGWSDQGYSLAQMRAMGLPSALAVLGTFLCSFVLGPLLLPWLPGRAFSVKGGFLGFPLAAGVLALEPPGWQGAAWLLIVPALSSFLLMNFTGATTFTSLSGVRRELRFALPAQIAVAVAGCVLWIIGLFVSGAHA